MDLLNLIKEAKAESGKGSEEGRSKGLTSSKKGHAFQPKTPTDYMWLPSVSGELTMSRKLGVELLRGFPLVPSLPSLQM